MVDGEHALDHLFLSFLCFTIKECIQPIGSGYGKDLFQVNGVSTFSHDYPFS